MERKTKEQRQTNYNSFKKLKIKIIKRKLKKERRKEKGKLYRTAKPDIEAEVYNKKKCDLIYPYTYTSISKIQSVTIKYNKLN